MDRVQEGEDVLGLAVYMAAEASALLTGSHDPIERVWTAYVCL
jgi:hypothetical protein